MRRSRILPGLLSAALLAVGAVGAGPGPLPGQESPAVGADARREAVEERLRARLRAVSDSVRPAEVAVALHDLAMGVRVEIEGDVRMHAASTMKVPVLYELFRQAEEGRLALDDPIRVRNEFTSIADGSTYSLTPGDDSEDELYGRVGEEVPVRELARRMIVRSSNLATNILIEVVGAASVRETMAGLGADGMRVLRGVEDIPAYRRGMNNTTTARAFARVLEAIARCRGVTEASCREMTEILRAQEFNSMIPAGIPEGVPVAHKTGWITGIHHDGGIVEPPGRASYILVILTRGIDGAEESAGVAARISAIVWNELVGG